MPYIKPEDREKVLNYGVEVYDMSAGEHNFLLTSLVNAWLGDKPDYATYERIIGRLECIKLELWRRRMVPYEELKCQQNGDIDGFIGNTDPARDLASRIGRVEGDVFSGTTEVVRTLGSGRDSTNDGGGSET